MRDMQSTSPSIPSKFVPVLTLSPKQFSIFCAYGEGKTASETASSEKISIKTVETHIAISRHKLGLKNSCLLRAFAADYLHWAAENKVTRRARPLAFEFNVDN